MRKIEWRPRAEDDLLELVDYIGQDSLTTALHFAQMIQEKVGLIASFPEAHRRGRVRGTRELVLHPNYILVYRVKPKVVEIVRLLHAAQRK